MTHHTDRTFRVSEVQKLEDPERLQWMPPQMVIDALALRSNMTVADIGAGTGYFAIPMSRVVAHVYAIDLQREMLEHLRRKITSVIPSEARDPQRSTLDGDSSPSLRLRSGHASRLGMTLVEGSADATTLPDQSCDVAFLATVWHELDSRDIVLAEMRRILKPHGTLAILDWRHDVERPPGPRIAHRIPMDEVIFELTGWEIIRSGNIGSFTYLVQAR